MWFSKVSAVILRGYFYYANMYGIIFFGITKGNRVIKCQWLKWYCLISRILCICYFIYYASCVLLSIEDINEVMLNAVRFIGCLACSVHILVMQNIHGQDLFCLVDKFLKIFHRVCALQTPKQKGYGGIREFIILLVIFLSTILIQCSTFQKGINYNSIDIYLAVSCDMFISVGANMMLQIAIIGYLSIAVLYTELHHYISHELRYQFKGLNTSFSRIRLREACNQLDNCLAIYEDIRSLGNAFNRIFEFSLFMVVMLNMTIMAMLSFKIVMEFEKFYLYPFGIVMKLVVDVMLLSFAVYEATTNSRMIKRLSFENYYITDEREWNLKLEMFLSRLNFYTFRVRLLGLFEVSNEFTLIFLSGLVTYLTFIVQYGMKMNILG